MIPTHLIAGERNTYARAADRSRAAYRKRTGADTLQTIAERRAWLATHAATMASKADAGGMAAVRKMHTARIVALETMSDASRIGGPATGDHLAILTRDAEHAAERLAILAPAKSRKTPARKLASVPDVVADVVETPAPDVTVYAADGSEVCSVPNLAPVTPASVPADVVTYPQIRAARKASRRELAATMRAAGIHPNGVAWQLARAGVDLADIPAILAGDAAMPEGVTS